MRNPMNSWERSDSSFHPTLIVGKNDLDLMKRLTKTGRDDRKFLRQIVVSFDVTAPLYWFKEFDTYKVSTVVNSTSTMHKIHSKPFELTDLSYDHSTIYAVASLTATIETLEELRQEYLETRDKKLWYSMIQLLPSSYNQTRTVTLNYEVLLNMYFSRRRHKLQEWRDFCDDILKLPYFKELSEVTKK